MVLCVLASSACLSLLDHLNPCHESQSQTKTQMLTTSDNAEESYHQFDQPVRAKPFCELFGEAAGANHSHWRELVQ